MSNTNHIIDASGKSIGRVATEAASVLMGKNSTRFARHLAPEVKVTIANAGKLHIEENKRDQKIYKTFSGYPGGLKEHSMTHVVAKGGNALLLQHAVKGMLPKNRLQDTMLKNLIITD